MGEPSLSSPSQNDRVHRGSFATGILFSKILILYIYIYKYIILDFIFIVSQGGGIGFKNNCDSVIVMRSAGCVRRVIVMGDFVKKSCRAYKSSTSFGGDRRIRRYHTARPDVVFSGLMQDRNRPMVHQEFLRSSFALPSL